MVGPLSPRLARSAPRQLDPATHPTVDRTEGGPTTRRTRLARRMAAPTPLAATLLTILLMVGLAACAPADDTDTTGTDEEPTTTADGDGETDGTARPDEADAEREGEDAERELPDEPADSSAGSGIVTQSDRLVPEEGPFSICSDCHAFLDPPGDPGRTLKENFSHERHLERDATCTSCHPSPTHTEEGIRYPQMVTCFDCHGEEEEATAPGDCLLCHPEDFDLVPDSHNEEFVEENHPQVAENRGREYCVLCHEGNEEDFCDRCHGLTIPHPQGFLPSGQGIGEHVDQAHERPDLCVRCHELRTDTPAACYGQECHGT